MAHTHSNDGPVCKFRTRKECDEEYANWQARSQVDLAEWVVSKGWTDMHKGNSVFDQLVQVMAGTRATITNNDGVQSSAPFARRLLAAIDAKKEVR